METHGLVVNLVIRLGSPMYYKDPSAKISHTVKIVAVIVLLIAVAVGFWNGSHSGKKTTPTIKTNSTSDDAL